MMSWTYSVLFHKLEVQFKSSMCVSRKMIWFLYDIKVYFPLWGKASCSSLWSWTLCGDMDNLELLVFLSLPPKRWDYRHTPQQVTSIHKLWLGSTRHVWILAPFGKPSALWISCSFYEVARLGPGSEILHVQSLRNISVLFFLWELGGIRAAEWWPKQAYRVTLKSFLPMISSEPSSSLRADVCCLRNTSRAPLIYSFWERGNAFIQDGL